MIDLFGKKMNGKAYEIEEGKKYLFIVEANSKEQFDKQVQLIKASVNENKLAGGIIINNPMTILDLERLSNLEHQQWNEFSNDVIHKLDTAGYVDAARFLTKKWEKLWIPYEQLSEDDKEKDRKFAIRILELK